MKTLRRLTILASLLTFALAAPAQVTSPDQIKTPPLRKFSMPQPKRIQLSNGMVIFLQEDHELPLIRGNATIRGGERNVPAAKTGLTGIYGQAWRTGGTAAKTGDALDETLESRAAHVETGADRDSTRVSLDVLEGDFDFVFPIWLDLLRNPAFREDKIDLAKTQANTAISRRNDEPGGILGREAGKLGYGPSSPYARQAEYASIASITRDDLLDFHTRTVHPNNVILSFIGDFDAAKLEKRLRTTFGSWKRGPQVPIPDPDIQPAKPGLYFVAKDDVTQASIAMVHGGTDRRNPDYHALVIMNEIFSGGFSGRLMQTLRTQRGLTYGVGGGVSAPWDYPGLFRVQMATKSETALESVQALREEVAKMAATPVTAEELSLAKESILNAFVFTMDTPEKALSQQVILEFYGFPSDYFTKYPAEIGKVTAADVERVAKQYIHPDRLAILVVGKEKDFEKPLSSLGHVTPIDITIPSVDAGEKSAAPAGSNAEGNALIGKVAQFAGGKALIESLKTMRRTGSMTMKTPQGEMQAEIDAVTLYPNSQRMVMKMAMGEITRVVSPEASFMITPMGTQDIPGSQRDASMHEMRAELLTVLRNIDNPAYAFHAAGTEKVGDVDARVLEIDAEGNHVTWLIDPATGRLLRSVSEASAMMPGDSVTDYSDWKSSGGLNLPMTTTVSHNGEVAASIQLTSVVVNPPVETGAFTKPEK